MANVTPKQEKFIIALMSTNTITEACDQAGITTNTGYRYLNNSKFYKEYMNVRRETMQQATNKLQQLAVKAAETLEDVMEDAANSTPSARVQAAKTVLDNSYKSLEMDDLQERLQRLEERINENKPDE